jgi:hypothetical protein
VAVVLSPKPSEKIPQWEQEMSAGAVCLSLVNACLAAGWGAGWLTGWRARHAGFCDRGLGLAPHESVAGFVHIGTETRTRPNARPGHGRGHHLDGRMILNDFLKALGQITDSRFLGVLAIGLGLTIALLVGFYLVFVDRDRLGRARELHAPLDRRDHLGRQRADLGRRAR